MQKTLILIIALFFLCMSVANAAANKKILYIDSYHQGYQWSAGIRAGIKNILQNRSDIALQTFQMDTKRNPSEESKKAAALKAKELIDSWHPDLVIASDDNASKYLIVPYYKGSTIPFVFCGVNWDAGVYGFPTTNVTGMVEVKLVDQIITTMQSFARGNRIAFLKGDDFSARKEADNIENKFHIKLDRHFVKNFTDWKHEYLALQDDADMILLGATISVSDWDADAAKKLIYTQTKVPTGNWDSWTAPYNLITYAAYPEEQGEYAAETALAILNGTPPAHIAIVANKKAKIYLNMRIAKILGIKFPMDLIENATLISAEQKKLFYVNSYHKGYAWSDSIEKGLLKALNITAGADGTFDSLQSKVDIKVYRMDTKRNKSDAFKKQAALAAKMIIDAWHPDIVITSDDNAAKYLLAPYYKDTAIPFVYCGVNWDASTYGLPSKNSTGIIEVTPALDTIAMLKKYAKGDRIGFIGANTFSEHKNIKNFRTQLAINFTDGKLIDTFSEWQAEYLRLQDSVDMLLWFNPVGIKGWDDKKAEAFIMDNTRIPSGGTNDTHVNFTLLGRVKLGEEQGWWAGKAALQILAGSKPADILPAASKQSLLYLNMKLAERMGIKFPMALIDKATFVKDIR